MAACTISGDGGPCDPCKRIEDIDARIVQVEKYLVSLKAERVALKTARNVYHDHLVRRLPLEIVSQIFQIYVDAAFDKSDDEVDDESGFSPFLVRRMEDAPLRLGAICHAWRAVAWASPRLWIKISVNVVGRGSKCIPELATQWLERTGQLPLTICLYEDTDDDSVVDINKELVISLMLIFFKLASRWRILSISLLSAQYIDDDNTTRFWSLDIDGKDCNLQHLQIEDCSPKFTAQLFKNLDRKPTPTHVSLSSVQMGCLDIDWSNAITVDIDSLTFQECIQLFQASARLQTFTLENMSFPHPVPTWSLSPVIIPMLRSLWLSHRSTSIILDCVTLPVLEELQWESNSRTVDSLISLVGRSHCRLTWLQIQNSKITDEFLLFLQATPSLESLIIDDGLGDSNAEHLFRYLATSNGSADLPNLATLQFLIYPHGTLPWKTIPDIYDPGRLYISDSPDPSASSHLQRRSLSLLLDITGTLDEIGYIDMVSLHHISVLLENKIDISIIFREILSNEDEDFIATSMDFHCPGESSTDSDSD